MKRKCHNCGMLFVTYPSRVKRGEGKFCSNKCANKHRGNPFEKNGNWKGGRYVLSDGYIGICTGGGKYRREHDLVMEKHIGRRLLPWENVHHINEDKTDNRLENLALMTASDHAYLHQHGSRKTEWVSCRCLGCGKTFERRKREADLHPNTYCTRNCYKKNANNDSYGHFNPSPATSKGSGRPGPEQRPGGPPSGRPSMGRPSVPTGYAQKKRRGGKGV